MLSRLPLGHKTPAPVVLFALPLLLGSAVWAENNVKQEMTAAVAAVRPALVRIHVVSSSFRQGRVAKYETAGSGVIISPDGYAVTNHHVTMDAERLFCTLADKREVEARLIGTDALADISVIKLISPDGKPFAAARFGDSSKLEVGDRVFAMGSPYALSQSVTMGIVSNVELIMPDYVVEDAFVLDGEDVGSIVRWIGHDALIAPGNSGGPLLSREGEIVGINEIEMGLSGAIPSNLARKVAEQIIKDGKVTRAWLGLEVQPLLQSMGRESGILISGVMEDSPAQKAGLRSGDVLVSLNGQAVTARFREEVPLFNQFAADLPVGKTVEAKVLREGGEVTVGVTTAERMKASDREHEIKSWGICGRNVTYLAQKEMQLASQDGVIVTGVLPSGPAGSAKPSLREGDLITSVGGEPVKDAAHLRAVSKRITDDSDEPVPTIVDFERKKKSYATVLKIGKKERSHSGAEVVKAWLPVEMQVLTRELAEGLGMPKKTGVRVTQVHLGSTAEKAGLRMGDLIVELDGEEIPAEQLGDEEVLPSLIRQYDIGAEVELGVIRGGDTLKVSVKLEPSPKPTRDYPKYENESFEFIARDIAFSDRADGSVGAGQSGAYVESVSEGSWAALGSLRSGDVISEVSGTRIGGLGDLERAMADLEKQKPKTVVLKVQRGIHTLFLEIKPAWPETGS